MIPDHSNATPLTQWFAAHTASCHEKRVAQHLSTRNIDFLLPVHRKVNYWKNGLRVPIESPLFPGYVFVKMEYKDRVRVLELPGVRSIVGAGRQPNSAAVRRHRKAAPGMCMANAEPHPFLKSGERAIIRGGPFEGMRGIVVRQRNHTRVVLTLDLIMKSISVEIHSQNLEVLGRDPVSYGYLPARASEE